MSNKKNLANINETRSESTDDKFCTLKFSMCDSKYPMHELNSNEIKEFVSFAKKIEKIQWKELLDIEKESISILFGLIINTKPVKFLL